MLFGANSLIVYTGMPSLSRLERLYLAARRLRQIQDETAAIYRRFPELERRPKIGRGHRPRTSAGHDGRAAAGAAKLH
jgi:hypothetical protein